MKENAIKKVIEQSKLTQTQVAEKLGVAQCTISEHSNKYVTGTIERAVEYSKRLDIKRDITFYGDGYKVRVIFDK